MASRNLLEVDDLVVSYPLRSGFLGRANGSFKAVDRISFGIPRGSTLGLVGESGCGKSSTARAVMMLTRPTSGSIRLNEQDLTQISAADLRAVRRDMQMIFQDPYASLDPRMRVRDIVAEPLRIHRLLRGKALEDRVEELVIQVGLDPAHLRRFPIAFSGGQRQWIGVARALALEPSLIICDEPVSALDVSVRAQVVNLLVDLQTRLNLTYLFIAHDLSVVDHVSDFIAIMYLGTIVEVGTPKEVRANPGHPYSRALISAMPVADPAIARASRRIVLKGDIPSPVRPPSGCRFHTRCWLFESLGRPDRCANEVPAIRSVAQGHQVACHFSEQVTLASVETHASQSSTSVPTSTSDV